MGYTTLENSRLRLTVDSLGAQMTSLQTLDGREYLWQGDPRYWCDRAPVLFPFVGRLTGNSYRYGGQVYSMGIHGFAAHQDFSCLCPKPNRLVLQLTDNGETREQYPFAFSLNIIYELIDNRVQVTYQVENSGTGILPFGIGGHPGFRVPLEEGEQFDDYVFDQDAVILKNMSREVTLRSRLSPHGVQVSYPDMPYLGLWHMPNTDAPYLCIEPWSSLPARQNVVEDFACKSDLIQLGPGKTYINTWSITIF